MLEDSRAVLIAADVPPDGPFPQDEKIKDGRSSSVLDTLPFPALWCVPDIPPAACTGVGTNPPCTQTRPGLVPVCWRACCCLSDQFVLGSPPIWPQPPWLPAERWAPVCA